MTGFTAGCSLCLHECSTARQSLHHCWSLVLQVASMFKSLCSSLPPACYSSPIACMWGLSDCLLPISFVWLWDKQHNYSVYAFGLTQTFPPYDLGVPSVGSHVYLLPILEEVPSLPWSFSWSCLSIQTSLNSDSIISLLWVCNFLHHVLFLL